MAGEFSEYPELQGDPPGFVEYTWENERSETLHALEGIPVGREPKALVFLAHGYGHHAR